MSGRKTCFNPHASGQRRCLADADARGERRAFMRGRFVYYDVARMRVWIMVARIAGLKPCASARIVVACALLACPCAAAAREVGSVDDSQELHAVDGVVDLDGHAVDPFAPSAEIRATALVFVTTDCPIANRYAPEIARLYQRFTTRGVRFWLVYANPAETAEAIRAHTRTFALPARAVRDTRHLLVQRFGITVTPETAVVDRGGRTIYRGRIDDRYLALGVDRPAVTRREFADALTAVLSGTPAPAPTASAVGCLVGDFRPVTFVNDVAPIMFGKCASCHRPTGPAPFSLLSYADVRRRATQIADVTRSRYMPPWKADPGATSFVGQSPLSDEEIRTIRRWVDEGASEGDPRETPPPPRFADGWQLGTPDLVVSIPEPYRLAPEATDVFRIFVIRLPVSVARYVTGIEFRPGNPRVVHHANIRLDRTPTSRDLDARDAAPGYDGLMARSAVYPEGHFLGWTPGQIAPLVPDDMAWTLEPGTDLVVQLHMQPSGAAELVQPSIGLFFGDRPPTRTPTILRLGSQGIDIPAGQSRYAVTDSYVLPADVDLHAIQPHAHYRLRDVRGTATFPDGSERVLIAIRDWDFRWQHVYRLAEPLRLPRGTRLAMHYIYDNSAANPRNPQQPPQRVFWGQRSIDEMGDLWFQFVATDDSARGPLAAGIQQKMTAEDIVGYETMLRANPADAELHDDVAVLYLSLARGDDAVRHFRASLASKPESPAAHFNLATALSVSGQLDEAVREYRTALALRPEYPSAHNNLGSVLASRGDVSEAIRHFREATRLDPANVQGQRNLSWYLATSGGASSAREAVTAGQRAARLTGDSDPQVLDTLAVAYAAAGQFELAVSTAERAASLAADAALREAVRARLALYREGRPYRTP
jgi:Flp pilus assembly protein TadD